MPARDTTPWSFACCNGYPRLFSAYSCRGRRVFIVRLRLRLFSVAAFPGFGALPTRRSRSDYRNASLYSVRVHESIVPKGRYARSSAASENTANTQLPLPVIITKLAPYPYLLQKRTHFGAQGQRPPAGRNCPPH